MRWVVEGIRKGKLVYQKSCNSGVPGSHSLCQSLSSIRAGVCPTQVTGSSGRPGRGVVPPAAAAACCSESFMSLLLFQSLP